MAIKVALMSHQDARWWDDNIQPTIDSSATPRADRNWKWGILRLWFPIIQFAQLRRCIALTTKVANTENQAVPAAMHLFVEDYPSVVSAPKQDNIEFIWFMSAAPSSALLSQKVQTPPSLGRIAIDTAIVASAIAGTAGRIGLHCAPAGGDRLLDFYQNHCRLHRVPMDATLPEFRNNDGRYFDADEIVAEQFASSMEPYR
jgi:hypothetical protein